MSGGYGILLLILLILIYKNYLILEQVLQPFILLNINMLNIIQLYKKKKIDYIDIDYRETFVIEECTNDEVNDIINDCKFSVFLK